MQLTGIDQNLQKIIEGHVDENSIKWLQGKMNLIIDNHSARDLFMTYSLIPSKITSTVDLNLSQENSTLNKYLIVQKADIIQVTRIFLMRKVLLANADYFTAKVAQLIEVADTGELATLLKFLIVLPNPEAYKNTAVEALRTNISTVFNSVAYYNPYPAQFFDDQQWNQMFLKTAFMQGDLSAIVDIDQRANKDLARIISDYAHERWAAGRTIDPDFWRPVAKFLNPTLLGDMKILLNSTNTMENRAGALSCYFSENTAAKKMLASHQSLIEKIENNQLSWKTLKEE